MSDEQINEYLNDMNLRAKSLEESLLDIPIKTEGKISLLEVYNMPFLVREMYKKMVNKYNEQKNREMA